MFKVLIKHSFLAYIERFTQPFPLSFCCSVIPYKKVLYHIIKWIKVGCVSDNFPLISGPLCNYHELITNEQVVNQWSGSTQALPQV